MKPLSATAETRIRTKITKLGKNQGKNWGKSRLNSILMLHDCVYERLTLKVVLRYGSCKLIKSFDCKLPLWCFLTEKWQLRCIETPMICIAFLVVDWACYSFLTVWGVLHMDYIMGFNTLEERVRKSVGKKMTVSDQINQQMLFKRVVLVNF